MFSGTCRDGEVLKLESFAKCTDSGCTCKSEVSSSNREIVTSDAHGGIYVKLWKGLYHDRHSELVRTDFILHFFQCGTDTGICKSKFEEFSSNLRIELDSCSSELWQSVSTAIYSCHFSMILADSQFSVILCLGGHSGFYFCGKCRHCCLPKLAAYHCMLSSLLRPYDCLAFLKVDDAKTVT